MISTVAELKEALEKFSEDDEIYIAFGDSDGFDIIDIETFEWTSTHFIIIDKKEVEYWLNDDEEEEKEND